MKQRDLVSHGLAVGVLVATAGWLFAGFPIPQADGNPDISGRYEGSMRRKLRQHHTGGAFIKDLVPVELTLTQRGATLTGEFVIKGDGGNEVLPVHGLIGQRNYWLLLDGEEEGFGTIEFGFYGRTKKKGVRSLRGKGISVSEFGAESSEIRVNVDKVGGDA